MSYVVSATISGAPKEMRFLFDLVEKALTQACALLNQGARNVSIRDEHGHHIEGVELEACCQNGMIQNDLKVVKLGR